jgi:hypothetical protein
VTARTLMQQGVSQLEDLFASSKFNPKVLQELEHELQYRSVSRAVALLADVRAALRRAAKVQSPIPRRESDSPMQQNRLPMTADRTIGAPLTTSQDAPAQKSLGNGIEKPPPPGASIISLVEAYKVLKVPTGSPWGLVERTRRQLVQQSHPSRMESLSAEERLRALAEARHVNAAYEALSQAQVCRVGSIFAKEDPK